MSITIKEFQKLNNTFEKMTYLIADIKAGDRFVKFKADLLKDHLTAARDFWVDLYRRKGK